MLSKRSLLIIGADGVIGAALWLSLSDSWNVYGTSRRKSIELNQQVLKLGLSPNAVEGFYIPEVDWVIYCASVSGFMQGALKYQVQLSRRRMLHGKNL